MNKFRFLTYVLLFAGLAVSSCQKSPTNSFSEEDNSKTEAVTSVTTAPGSFAKASLNSEPSLIIEGGHRHTCAYYPEDGNVVCWGDTYNWEHLGSDHSGSNTDDYMEGDAVKADIGNWTNCILKEDGTTKCWGRSSVALEYSEGDAIDVAVGDGNACVLTEDGNIKCTGSYLGGDNWILLHDQGNAVDVLMSSSAACAQTENSNTLQCQGWNVTETSWEVNGTPTGDANGHYAMCVLTEEGNMDCMNSGYNNGPYGAYGPQGGYTLGYHRTDESMPRAIDMDASFGIGCYALENGDINCFTADTEDQIDISHPGVDAIAVSVSGVQDICYSDASGNITCTESTPDEYTPTNGGGTNTSVYISDASVTTYDPIFPSSAYTDYSNTVCYQENTFGLDAKWVNPHNAFEVGPHSWENGTIDAKWINSYNSIDSQGPEGHNWSKYETDVSGNGDFVVQLIADNCSWVYLSEADGSNPELIGYQETSSPRQYGLSLNGDHKLTFVIFDGGGLAGGKFRLETTESFGGDVDPIETNTAPTAHAGPDQSVQATGPGAETTITLDGSGSTDAEQDKLTYSWALNGKAVATGKTPTVSLGRDTHTLSLTVSDGELEDTDEVTIEVYNVAPVVKAGADQNFEASGPTSPFKLSGSATDANNDNLSYSWTLDGAEVATTASASFDKVPGVYIYTLTVDDGYGGVVSDDVTVKITDTTAPKLTFNTETTNLWPPNHKMVLVASNIQADDIVDGLVAVDITIESSEDANGKGDGNTDPDYEIDNNPDGSYNVYLRAERSGNGNDRTYIIRMSTVDEAGNPASAELTASVPHDKKGNGNVSKGGKKGN